MAGGASGDRKLHTASRPGKIQAPRRPWIAPPISGYLVHSVFVPRRHPEPGPGKPMYLLVFDFDSTLVSVEGLDELFARSLESSGGADAARRLAEFRQVTDLGMAGAISAEESLHRRLGALRVDRETIDGVAARIRERLTPSVERHLPFFRQNASRIHVVSGGFEELIRPSLGRLGLPATQLHAHRFVFDQTDRVIGLDPQTRIARGGKVGVVRSLGRHGAPVWMVGDGVNDLEVRLEGIAERFIAFTENRRREPVVAGADHVAESMDDVIRILESRPTSRKEEVEPR